MTTYTYTGKLADFASAPFPNARPRLWVGPETDPMQPHRGVFGPEGEVLAARPVEVPLREDGTFSVDLIASADLTPPTRYSLRCEWLDADNNSYGWDQWTFTALVGGGLVSEMPDAEITRIWWGVDPPPVSRAGIYWIHPVTGDVKEWL